MQILHDTVVIGGGQSGMAMSYHLRKCNREHVVLERKRVAERWLGERWDSLRFQFPNWSLRLPGFEYAGDSPDAFAHHRDVGKFVEDYAKFIDAPVRCGTEVSLLRRDRHSDRFLIKTNDSLFSASRVVVATGPFQRPSLPAWSRDLPPHVYQVHASDYRNPEQLPPGAVLVVGSGASGCQIADELNVDGRVVYFSVSAHRRVPRRYRDRDNFWWFMSMGRFDVPINSFPGRKYPTTTVITGVNGGYDVDVRRFILKGGVVLGRLEGVAGGKLYFNDDAEYVLTEADRAYSDFRHAADECAKAKSLDLPVEDAKDTPGRPVPVLPIPNLDLKTANIGSVVWCTGYTFDFGWLDIPVFDEGGAPIQERGVTNCPNLYFLGLHWMHTFKSGLLFGVGEDAAYIADHMAEAG
ncbi:NAD(P)-binding domain-containing protein [Rhizobium leguminosarum]